MSDGYYFRFTYNGNSTFIAINSWKECWGVFALERSGHHAVINWLLKQDGPTSIHVDTFIKNNKIGHCTAGVYEYNGKGNVRNLRESKHPREDLTTNRLVVSTENITVRPAHDKTIVILRSYPNWLASYYAMKGSSAPLREMSKLWRNHSNSGVTTIHYDQWYTSEEYRNALCNQLGLTFTDKGFTEISKTGGGSSFDDMDVLNRWQRFKDDPVFMEVMKANADLY